MRSVDLPEALPHGSRLLHIGLPKTGTTALQGALHRAREPLESLGVHNVSPKRHEMKVAQTAADVLPDYWGRHWDERWEELAADFRGSDARCVIWSSETLSQAPAERIGYLAEKLGADTHIVVTLRPLAPLLVSQWQEWLRRRGTLPLDEWLRSQLDAVTPDGTVTGPPTRFMPPVHRFSLARLVRDWGSVFGEDRITFLVGDKVDRQRNLRVFESLMGVPQLLEAAPDDNASMPYPEAEMLRRFNIAYTERGGDHPTWMFAISQRARNPMREFTKHTEPHPIRPPRWAVEECNQYVAGWIEAVEGSGVTVVGDLQDLLVDPDDFPETVDVPDRVSVETAGRLMDVAFDAALQHGEQRGRRAALQRRAQVTPPTLERYAGRELARELVRRAKGRLRHPRRRAGQVT